MSAFDPVAVHKAVAAFTPRQPQKFQDLFPAKDVIAELRRKRASYRAIAELLTQHCLPTSKTAIAMFCHKVLGEIVRPHRRPMRKRPPALPASNADETSPGPSPETDNRRQEEPSAAGNGQEAPAGRARGPRIAQVRLLKPENA